MLGGKRSDDMTQSSFLMSATVQAQTMSALSVRFLITRYGRENIGFLWVIVEPMILCVGVMSLFSVIKGTHEHGLTIVALVLTGYMPLTLQRHLSLSGLFVIRSGKQLLIHRNIKYLDYLLSRLSLELLATSSAAMVIYFTLVTMRMIDFAHDHGLLLLGWFLMASISAALACIYAGLSEISDAFDKFIPAFNYLTLPISGVFFMVDWLPSAAQEIILYVPLVHAYEAVRAGMFGPGIITHYSLFYGYSVSFLLAAVGLVLTSWARDRV